MKKLFLLILAGGIMMTACKKESCYKQDNEVCNCENNSQRFELPEIDTMYYIKKDSKEYKLLKEQGIISNILNNINVNETELNFILSRYKNEKNIYTIHLNYFSDTTNYTFYMIYLPSFNKIKQPTKIQFNFNNNEVETYQFFNFSTNKWLYTIIFNRKNLTGKFIENKETPFDYYFDRCCRKHIKEMWNSPTQVYQFATCPPCYTMIIGVYCAIEAARLASEN